jgi:endonuclease I
MRSLIFSIGLAFCGLVATGQEPGAQPTNMNFYNVKPYGFSMSFTPASAAGYLRSQSPITFTPQDGVEYQKGQGVATGVKVFAFSASSSVNVKEVLGGNRYYFAIYAYNGSGSSINYKNNNPLTGSIDVPPGGPANYYGTISGGSPTVLADLKQRLNTGRVFQSYTPGYISNLMVNFYIRDTVGSQQVSVCQYTGRVYISDPPYTWWGTQSDPGEFTREHALPKSWMHTGGNTNNQDGADYHNLFPVDQDKANARRSNYPYGIVQNVTYQYLQGKLGTNINGITVYEPRNNIKGDVARAHFYMMTCYNGNSGVWGYQNMPTYAVQQSQELMKEWHEQDPPDDFERTRHEYIYSVQFNRNPYIDYPEIADCINFDNMTLYSGCAITLGIEDMAQNHLTSTEIFPNPAIERFSVNDIDAESVEVYVTDLNGRLILSENFGNLFPGSNQISMDISSLNPGIYFVRLQSGSKQDVKKLVINR